MMTLIALFGRLGSWLTSSSRSVRNEVPDTATWWDLPTYHPCAECAWHKQWSRGRARLHITNGSPARFAL